MNEIHSRHESKYKSRWIAPIFRKAVKDYSVVVLTGARQVGKSTFLQHESPFADWPYISFDDFDALARAKSDPSSLWAGTNRLVLDEVQKATNVLDAIKMVADSRGRNHRFILSGSANILLMKEVSESLAGRAVYFSLYPMTIGEMQSLSVPNLLQSLFRGDLPGSNKKIAGRGNPFLTMWKGFMPPLMEMKKPGQQLHMIE